MTTDRHIAIVCNTKAGKGKALQLVGQLERELSQRKIIFTLFTDKWPQTFSGFTDIFIVGGDGTLNYFINQYPQIELPLAIFKGGSGNDFAWKLYGNASFAEQLNIILASKPSAVDAGICNDRYFLNGVGIGFDGEVVKAMGKKRFISAGYLSYLWTVVKKVSFFREREMQIEYEGGQQRQKYFMISVANGSRYGGGFLVAPQANTTDGQLDIVTIQCIHRIKRFFYLPQVQKGKHLQLSFVETALTKKITICSPQIIAGHADGELIEDRIFNIRILPAHFRFLYSR